MMTQAVVKVEVGRQPLVQLGHRVVAMQVQALVLDAPPQPLDKHVVQGSPAAIHADGHAGALEASGERGRRVLRTLIGVEDLGPALLQGILHRFQAERAFQAVGQTPGQHVTAVPIDHRRQVHEPAQQRHKGDVRGPHLVGPHDGHASQKIGKNTVLGVAPRGSRSRVNGLDAHHAHQPLHAFAVHDPAFGLQPDCHPPRAVERRAQVLLVDQPHQTQVVLRFWSRLVMPRGAVQSQQLALPANAQRDVAGFNQTAPCVRRARQIFFSTSLPPSLGGRSARTVPPGWPRRHASACVDPRTTRRPARSTLSATPRPDWHAARTGWPTPTTSCRPSPPPRPPWPERRPQTRDASVSSFGPPEATAPLFQGQVSSPYQVVQFLGSITDHRFGRLQSVVYAWGTVDEATWQFDYDLAGNLIGETDPLNRRTDNVYDKLDRLLSVTLPDPDADGPLDPSIYQMRYDPASNVVLQFDPLNKMTVIA